MQHDDTLTHEQRLRCAIMIAGDHTREVLARRLPADAPPSGEHPGPGSGSPACVVSTTHGVVRTVDEPALVAAA